MKRFSEQLHKKATTVSMRAAEKRALRERVVSYMEYHPLPAEMKKKRVFADAAALTEDYRVIRIPFMWVARVAASMAILVFVVVPVVAERAVPGDGLYAIKVRFNEEVRSTLSFTTSQKVAWETERLNRRISEARLLASEGKLTEEVEATVAAAVRTHADEAQRNIELLRDVDADEAVLASIAFETTLEVQSASLRKQPAAEDSMVMMMMAKAVSADETSDQVDLLSSALQDSIAKNTASNAASSIPAFEKTMARVEQNTTRIYELLDSIQGVMTEEQRTDVSRRASDIARTIQEITASRMADEEAARQQLVEVLQRTQRLIVYMNDLAISNAIDIEDLVPVMLTEVEKQQEISQYQADTNALIGQIENALLTTTGEALTEKALATLDQMYLHQSIIASSTDHALVEFEATAARAIAEDILRLYSLEPVTNSGEVTLPDDTLASTTASTTEIVSEVILPVSEVDIP